MIGSEYTGRTSLVLWIYMYFLILLWSGLVEVSMSATLKNIGVNWGGLMAQPIDPKLVVPMLQANGISKVKLFEADAWTVSAFAGTNIEVMLGIPNLRLQQMNKYDAAKEWVKQNVSTQVNGDKGVNIRYVAVGNEPLLKSYKGKFDNTLFPAMQNIQRALNEKGLGDQIKVTVPMNADVYESPDDKPSSGQFRKDVAARMGPILKFLELNKSPFLVNIYPFLSLSQGNGFPVEYCFFGGSHKIYDHNAVYTNVFDANYDTLAWALNKSGFSDIKIFIGEIGWPTDGAPFANNTLAKKFYDGLMKKLANKEGTPLRKTPMELIYLFSLFDENQKSVEPGYFERHWGIFQYDGTPKFDMDLSGAQATSTKKLIGVQGVKYLDPQWCVVTPKNPNKTQFDATINYACFWADCSALQPGASCSNLSKTDTVSYVLNQYFQIQDQDVEACNFNGLATIVKRNASVGNCVFPIAIDSSGFRIGGYGSTFLIGFFVLGLFIVRFN